MISMQALGSFFQWANSIVGTFGYFGIFLVSMLATSTIIFPTYPLSIIIFLSGAVLNPLLVGVAAGVGSAIGEMVGYTVGRGGERVLAKKYKKQIMKIEKLFQKYKGEVIIFFFAAIPVIPFDMIGIFCGIVGFDTKKFFLSLLLGKVIRYTFIAFAGYYGAQWVLGFLGSSP